MKKIISLLLLALCASLGSIANVSAVDYIDERFTEFIILPTIIYPADNGVRFIANDPEHTPYLKSFAIFVSETDYSSAELEANYPTLPSDLSNPFIQVDFLESDEFTIDSDNPLSAVALINSAPVNALYYIFSFWDGSIEAKRVSFQNCIDEAGGKTTGLECRISRRGNEIIYKAYLNEVELAPEPKEGTTTSSADDEYARITTNNTSAPVVEVSGNSPAADIISENVKNTKTDKTTATSVGAVVTNNNTLPPNTPENPDFAAIPTAAITQPDIQVKDLHWWAIYPFAIMLAIFFWFFFILPRKKTQDESEQRQLAK